MGCLVFMQNDGAGAKAIRSPSRGWANHVGAVRRLAPGEKIIEAVVGDMPPVRIGKQLWAKIRRQPANLKPSGVIQVRSLAEAALTNEVRVFQLPEIPEAAEDAWWAWLQQQLGKGYDEPAILGFVASYLPFVKALPLVGHALKDAQTQDARKAGKKFMCSELQKAAADQRPHGPLQGQLCERPGDYAEFAGVYLEPWRCPPEELMWSPLLREIPPSVWRPLVGLAA